MHIDFQNNQEVLRKQLHIQSQWYFCYSSRENSKNMNAAL